MAIKTEARIGLREKLSRFNTQKTRSSIRPEQNNGQVIVVRALHERGTTRKLDTIWNQFTQERDEPAIRTGSEYRAQESLPELKSKIADLITTKLESPVIITVDVDHTPKELTGFEYHGSNSTKDLGNGRRVRIFDTNLYALVRLEDRIEFVTVSSTKYPDKENPGSEQRLGFQVNIHGEDEVLYIDQRGLIIRSKEWAHEPYTMYPTLGYPAKERYANEEDVKKYSDLIDRIYKKGFNFLGSTPPIARRPWVDPRPPELEIVEEKVEEELITA